MSMVRPNTFFSAVTPEWEISGQGTAKRAIVAEAKRLAELSPGKSVSEIASTWAQLVVLVALCLYLDAPWAYALGFVLIGARQYALLILLHDGSHCLLHPKRRTNDILTLWLLAAPCGSSYFNSRSTHLKHHRFLGDSVRDPDFFLYCSGQPAPKLRTGQFLWHFTKLLFGGQIAHTLFGNVDARSADATNDLGGKVRALFPVAVVQAGILALFTLAGHSLAYFFLWVLPLLTLAVLFNGARVFCDHANRIVRFDQPDALLISYFSNPVERFFFSPFHMNYHAEHHFFPYVPHYNLPKLRLILQGSPQYRDRIQWRRSYIAYMIDYLLGKDVAPAAVTLDKT